MHMEYKYKRFNIRISEENLEVIKAAARLQGINVSTYLRMAALDRARAALKAA
jgi:predicted DNA binding CopG/RHH family protein